MPKKPTKKELQKDLEALQLIDSVVSSEGGKVLINKIKQDIILSVEVVAGSYIELSHPQLIARCAELQAKLNLLKVFIKAKSNTDWLMEELEKYDEE